MVVSSLKLIALVGTDDDDDKELDVAISNTDVIPEGAVIDAADSRSIDRCQRMLRNK